MDVLMIVFKILSWDVTKYTCCLRILRRAFIYMYTCICIQDMHTSSVNKLAHVLFVSGRIRTYIHTHVLFSIPAVNQDHINSRCSEEMDEFFIILFCIYSKVHNVLHTEGSLIHQFENATTAWYTLKSVIKEMYGHKIFSKINTSWSPVTLKLWNSQSQRSHFADHFFPAFQIYYWHWLHEQPV